MWARAVIPSTTVTIITSGHAGMDKAMVIMTTAMNIGRDADKSNITIITVTIGRAPSAINSA